MRLIRTTFLAALLLTSTQAFAVEHLDARVVNSDVNAGQMVLIDIRTPAEWADTGVAPNATPIDMTSASFIPELKKVIDANPGKQLTFMCRSGHRSGMLTEQLEAAGLKGLADVKGGMNEWLADGLPVKQP